MKIMCKSICTVCVHTERALTAIHFECTYGVSTSLVDQIAAIASSFYRNLIIMHVVIFLNQACAWFT